jgi:hypothetical protein
LVFSASQNVAETRKVPPFSVTPRGRAQPQRDLLAIPTSVKGYTLMVNSVHNGWRMEDVWLDK